MRHKSQKIILNMLKQMTKLEEFSSIARKNVQAKAEIQK